MTRRTISIVSATALGGAAGLIVTLAGQGFDGSAAHRLLGWSLPVSLAAISGGVSWLLLSDEGDADLGSPRATAHCGTCGSSVIEDWRLCPYCGTRVDDLETTAGAPGVDINVPKLADSEGAS